MKNEIINQHKYVKAAKLLWYWHLNYYHDVQCIFFMRDLLAEVPPCALGKRKLFVHGHARC